jgi:hypothetical protein
MRSIRPLPLQGVANQVARIDQPFDTAPPDALVNFTRRRGRDGTDVLGTRPGMAKAFATRFGGGGPVRGLFVIQRAVDATTKVVETIPLIAGTATAGPDVGGTNQPTTRTGAAWVFSRDGAVLASFADAQDTARKGRAIACDLTGIGYFVDGTGTTPQGPLLGCVAWTTSVSRTYAGGSGIITRVHYTEGTGVPLGFGDAGNTNPDIAHWRTTANSWTAEIEDKDPGGSVGTPINLEVQRGAIAIVGPWVLAAAGPYIYVFQRGGWPGQTGGTYVARVRMQWAWAAQSIAVAWAIPKRSVANPFPAGGAVLVDDHARFRAAIYVAYRGTPTVTGIVGVDDKKQGDSIRGAIATYSIGTTGSGLTHVPAQDQRATTDPNYEAHGDLRFFDFSSNGRGRTPLQIAVFPYNQATLDASLASLASVVGFPYYSSVGPDPAGQSPGEVPQAEDGRTGRGNRIPRYWWIAAVTPNDGFGPSAVPDGAGGYANVWMFDRAAEFNGSPGQPATWVDYVRRPVRWQVDSVSAKNSVLGGTNDIPYNASGVPSPDQGLGPMASANAVAVDPASRRVYVGGATVDGINVRCLNMDTGAVIWVQSVGAMVPVGGICVLQDGRVVVGAKRNNAWPSQTGQASLFILAPATGAIVKTHDFGTNVNVQQVAPTRFGGFVVTTDAVT